MINRNEVAERLLQCREKVKKSRAEVARLVGIGTTTLRQWEVAATEASMETIEKLARLYNVSPQYIIFGDTTSTTQPAPVQSHSITKDEYTYIPAYDIEASAGYGSFVNDKKPRKHLAFRSRWLKARGLHQKDLAAIFTKGDSMEPTIPNGAALIIDQSRNNAVDGNIYVIRIDDSLYVKRIQKIPSGLRLISDNKFYKDLDLNIQEYTDEQFKICGQVIHVSYDLD